ncbi:MAG: hypothetical protein Q8R40_02005 [bacterium]|nr:hypothetical protein [bacterium]
MDKKHCKCLLWKGLWALGLITLILAWVSNYTQAALLGYGALAWFWTALVLGVLAIPIKLDCHDCSTCSVKSAM